MRKLARKELLARAGEPVSLALLEMAADQLGPLVDDVAFVGGASLFLWIDDPGAPEPRATLDVDVIVVVDGRADYYRLSERLREQGFSEDDRSGIICRWRGAGGLILDVMPTDERILGFSNRWYENALETAQDTRLPSGTRIRAVTPPYLLATKLEAFRSRGGGDYTSEHRLRGHRASDRRPRGASLGGRSRTKRRQGPSFR